MAGVVRRSLVWQGLVWRGRRGGAWSGRHGRARLGAARPGMAGLGNLITKRTYIMADTTGFEKAWRHRAKNSVRHLRAPLKKAHSRLNRREGRINLMDACIHKLNERNVT